MLDNKPIRAYLPDVRTFGFSGPRDDARYGQTRLAGVNEICGVHLSSQRLDVLQNGHFNLNTQQRVSPISSTGGSITLTSKNHCAYKSKLLLLYLQIRCLSLIDDESHQNVELLVKREGLPEKRKTRNEEF